jgi:2-polyprenyl-3-methyl-5-hydroxy-6-metoxy-1,4-benzoquinol methylase
MIYLLSFFYRLKLKSIFEFSFILTILTVLIFFRYDHFFLLTSLFKLIIIFLSHVAFLKVLKHLSIYLTKKFYHSPYHCSFCLKPLYLLYPQRKTSNFKGSFACSSFDHAHYPDIYFCFVCLNGQQNFSLIHKNLIPLSESTVEQYKNVVDTDYLNNRSARIKTYTKIHERYKKYFRGKHLLEIGCYYGAFYEVIQNDCLSYTGIEPSRHACNFLYEKFPHIKLFQGSFEEACAQNILPQHQFDTIILFDVIEHVESPLELLKSVKNYLKPNGMILFSTINIESFVSLALGPKWPWYMDMHYYYFTDYGIAWLLKKAGLQLTQHDHFPYWVHFSYLLEKLEHLFGKTVFPLIWINKKMLSNHKQNSWMIPITLGDTILISAKGPEHIPLQESSTNIFSHHKGNIESNEHFQIY